tara:strand:+ start:298 stop:858 length:561 start_codon:yes stop_codon:yes gene_type:complete
MPSAADSSFDVAMWFSDRALQDNAYLQPQKLHRLLYVSQAFYAVDNDGRKLMPSIFVADHLGPIEPNVYRAFTNGRPDMDTWPLPEDAEVFLNAIWERYSHHSADHLSKTLMKHTPFLNAFKRAPGAEISLDDMIAFYGRFNRKPKKKKKSVDPVDQLHPDRPTLLVSQTGRAVSVTKWVPGQKPG